MPTTSGTVTNGVVGGPVLTSISTGLPFFSCVPGSGLTLKTCPLGAALGLSTSLGTKPSAESSTPAALADLPIKSAGTATVAGDPNPTMRRSRQTNDRVGTAPRPAPPA